MKRDGLALSPPPKRYQVTLEAQCKAASKEVLFHKEELSSSEKRSKRLQKFPFIHAYLTIFMQLTSKIYTLEYI